jgi:DNA-directed RNA polymerase subunit RPC12/RpoP
MTTKDSKREPPVPCPECQSRGFLREIFYGMPMTEPDPDRFVLGGCEIDDFSPKYKCINCDWSGSKFGDNNPNQIDTTFDMRIDANGLDPDSNSKTLKSYHQTLWSKPLPDGRRFDLSSKGHARYLSHSSEVGEFALSSDSIAHSYKNVKRMSGILESVDPEIVESFRNLGYTIGGFIVFPGNRIGNKVTINGARGLSPMIADRFDLTLECIRRHYQGIENPLESTLNRYHDFFAVFQNFDNYVEFFLLEDLIISTTGEIKFFLKNTDAFPSMAFPSTGDEYLEYRENSMEFLVRRNQRIQDWCDAAPRKIHEDWNFK